MSNPYSPLKVYVAARWDDRDVALELKRTLERNGLIVTSTWLTPHDNQSMDALKARGPLRVVADARERAIKDFEDIDASDVLLVYSPKSSHRNGTGGKHVETGYALANGKPVFVLGDRENIFHYHPMARSVGSIREFFTALEIAYTLDVVTATYDGGEGTTL
jgi:nucleoside 2-deoxyribosyltransferase